MIHYDDLQSTIKIKHGIRVSWRFYAEGENNQNYTDYRCVANNSERYSYSANEKLKTIHCEEQLSLGELQYFIFIFPIVIY